MYKVAAPTPPLVPSACGLQPVPSHSQLGNCFVACHEHGTNLSGLVPASWDHLFANCGTTRRVVRVESLARLLASDVMFVDVEVNSGGVQGGRRG
jgi:hypothetical protein